MGDAPTAEQQEPPVEDHTATSSTEALLRGLLAYFAGGLDLLPEAAQKWLQAEANHTGTGDVTAWETIEGDSIDTVTISGSEYLYVGHLGEARIVVDMGGTDGDVRAWVKETKNTSEKLISSDPESVNADSTFRLPKDLGGAHYLRITCSQSATIGVGGGH